MILKKSKLEEYLKALKKVKRGMKHFHKTGKTKGRFDSDCGLCANISDYIVFEIGDSARFLDYRFSIFRKWENFSGNKMYPIPPKDMMETAKDYYDYGVDYQKLYTGRQYKMRLKLINHMINCVKEDLKRENA